MIGYVLLAITIVFELIGITALKCSDGFTRLCPTVVSIVSYILCYVIFSKCLRHIDLCIAYSTWSAVGIVASAMIGILFFSESLSKTGWIGVLLLVVGVILINR
ncbi:MAG: multidrug efflux SMR transporter [Lachnospiraceae bacterium]|nr:multidrug efflux SMR transporter [Lachnospiraceae bacterium]